MRPLLRSSLSVLVLCFILYSNSFCAIALAESSTESAYEVMPLVLYDDETFNFSTYFYLGDYGLDNFSIRSSTYSTTLESNVRLSSSRWNTVRIDSSSANQYDKYVKVYYQFTDTTNGIFYPLGGLEFSAHKLLSNLSYASDTNSDVRYRLAEKKPVQAYYWYDSSTTDVYGTGSINLNNIIPGNSFDISFTIPKDPTELNKADNLYVCLIYELPDFIEPSSVNYINLGIDGDGSFVYGGYISDSSSSSPSDYNQNVEAELGNIQTGIDNVINSVVQMGNQAWQGAQQTVQAVTQMTTQLSNVIDQQRQDILNGLGLLGDDISNTMTNVKNEITNVGTSISNKMEQTTETIVNTVETKVDEVTVAVTEVKDSVVEVKDSILDLPNKISEMLIGLVVPDEQTMIEQRDNWDSLLAERFGAVYESVEVMDSIAAAFQSSAETSTITLPAVTVGLAGTDFTFGGYDVEVVPEGFEALVTALKLIIDIVVTLAFINAMKSRYEQLVSR